MEHFVILCSIHRLLVTANVVPSSLTPVTRMMEAPSSSETSVLTRAKRGNIPEDTILHSNRRENLKFYKFYASFWNIRAVNQKTQLFVATAVKT
jgi:hypothetical protein